MKILNGVSGEEEARFVMPVNPAFSERDFLNALDKQCQERTGQMLSGLKWLSPVESGRRFQRRKCDMQMVQELSACVGIMSGLYGMENGRKPGNEEKMDNQMENNPQLTEQKWLKKGNSLENPFLDQAKVHARVWRRSFPVLF